MQQLSAGFEWFKALLQKPKGVPKQYENVILHIPGDDKQEEIVTHFESISRPTLERVLDRQGCDLVLNPVSKGLIGFDKIELQDNMLLQAVRLSTTPLEARISTLEGFQLSSVSGFETDATEAVYNQLQKQNDSVQVLPIREIKSADGKKREVDGVVIADGCAAILEAKQVLDDTAVQQLASVIDFIRDNDITGPAAALKDKKLVGFVAGKTLSNDPGRVKALVKESKQRGYGILVSNGRSLGVGNNRVPKLPVDCAMRKRACGAYSCPVRVVL